MIHQRNANGMQNIKLYFFMCNRTKSHSLIENGEKRCCHSEIAHSKLDYVHNMYDNSIDTVHSHAHQKY